MKSDIIRYLLGRFIPAFVGLAVIVLSVRFVGVVEYGRFSLLIYTSLLAVTLSFHWVQVSIVKFLGGMLRETNTVMSRFFDLTFIGALFSTVIVLLFCMFFFNLGILELTLVSLCTFLTHFYLFHQAVLQAFHRSIRCAILEGIYQVLILGSLLTGLFIFGWHTSALLIGSLVFGLVGVLILRSLIRVKGLLTIDVKHFYWDSRFSGKVVEFGYGVALWLFLSHLLMAADRFMLMRWFGYHDSGIYSALKDIIYRGVTFASFPIYISYQTKVVDMWNSHHKAEAWKTIKEALSFELLIFILIFIVFMVIKPVLFHEIMRVPELDFWLFYLPVLISAFLWQVSLLLHRFVELVFKSSRILIALAVTVVLNIILNIIFLPGHSIVASSLVLMATTILYSGFVIVMALLAGRRIHAD